MKRVLLTVLVLGMCTPFVGAAEPAGAGKDSKVPAPVGKEMMRFLNTRINLAVSDMSPSFALEWQLKLADIPLSVEATEQVDNRKVTFSLVDVTLAEALRRISESTGAQYRLTPTTIRLALADEWKAIDAGTRRFEELKKKVAVQTK